MCAFICNDVCTGYVDLCVDISGCICINQCVLACSMIVDGMCIDVYIDLC